MEVKLNENSWVWALREAGAMVQSKKVCWEKRRGGCGGQWLGVQDSKGSHLEGASAGPGGGVGSRPHRMAAALGGPSVTAMTASWVRPSDSGTHRSERAQGVIPDC